MKYIPGLNGLRAIAVFIVIIFHWGLPPFPVFSLLKNHLPDGSFGVNLFFVLSGFLITSILLIEKSKLPCAGNSPKRIITNFYSRRFLRIFPIYYLTIFGLLFTSLPYYKNNFPYYVTYTENFHVVVSHSWDSFSHTWSLAVEEQFYLLWPFVIIFTKKSWLRKVFIFCIIMGPLFSIFQTAVLKPPLNEFILTPSCFDAFGIGALLAYQYVECDMKQIKKWIKILLPFSIILFVYWTLAPQGGHAQYLKRFFESIIGCALILFCLSCSFARARNILLENRIMNQFGLVSYGIYLYHYALPWFYTKAKQSLHVSFGKYDAIIDYFFMIIILLLLAFLSFYKIEKPILRLKKKFNY